MTMEEELETLEMSTEKKDVKWAEGEFGHNGGVRCDVLDGPCSCGAWHHPGEKIQDNNGRWVHNPKWHYSHTLKCHTAEDEEDLLGECLSALRELAKPDFEGGGSELARAILAETKDGGAK